MLLAVGSQQGITSSTMQIVETAVLNPCRDLVDSTQSYSTADESSSMAVCSACCKKWLVVVADIVAGVH
jgi:hypothetical protein